MSHKSQDPCFHKKYMEAGVMTFKAHCTYCTVRPRKFEFCWIKVGSQVSGLPTGPIFHSRNSMACMEFLEQSFIENTKL